MLEDWGGGTGYAKRFVKNSKYRLVDFSPSRWLDEMADLEGYTSNVEAVLLRHVLEHNRGWKQILLNATHSASLKLAVVLFIPIASAPTHNLYDEGGVCNLQINATDFHRVLRDWRVRREEVGTEELYLAERPLNLGLCAD